MTVDYNLPNLQGATALSTDTHSNSQVDRIHISTFSSQDFRRYYQNPGIPVIVGGLLNAEPQWDLDYLCQCLGNQVFPIRRYGQSRYQQDKRQWTSSGSGVEAHSMTFSEYATCLRAGVAKQQDLYLARCSLKQTPLESGHSLYQAEAWFNLKFPATPLNLWVGVGGHTSCLHYDPMDGLLMQLHGAKKILLFPPHQTYNLYPIPIYKQFRHGLKLRPVYSQVYPESPDLQAFPRFSETQPHCLEGILHPGEILFLPCGWWHEVTSLGDGVVCSVNRFWNVLPLSRAFSQWNKWRAHLGSFLAAPHVISGVISARLHPNASNELKKLIQRL